MSDLPQNEARRWYTVQCGFADLNAHIVTVQAKSLDEACSRALEEANNSSNWRRLDACGPTYIDAVAEGRDVPVWHGTESILNVPTAFAEDHDALIRHAALTHLLAWAEQSGIADAPCWHEARRLVAAWQENKS